MANSGLFLLHLFLFLSLLFTSAFPRTLPQKTTTTTTTTITTTVLDVSASIQKTLDVLTFKSPESESSLETYQEIDSDSWTSGGFSLELHSRDVIHKSSSSHKKDYKALVQSRLERDSARVKSLNLKLDLAVKGIKKSDLVPLNTEGVEAKTGEDLQGSIVSGASQGSGEYFCKVGIGRPPRPQLLVLDTGSDVTWLQCQPCSDCYQQSDPIFDPSTSSTYSPVSCQSSQCQALDVSACRNGSCLYQVSYGDGSYTVGEFVTETLTFGNSSSVSNIAVGCGHDNEGLFVGSSGLLGLGGGKLSFPAQVKATAFSYCLVDRNSDSVSTLQFGRIADPTNAVTAPLLRNRQMDTFYYVALTGLSVGGELLSIPPSAFEMDKSGNGGIIVDSGTAITRLKTEVYESLRDAFVKKTPNLPSTNGVALFDTCYDLSSMSSVQVPTVNFHFSGGKSLPLPAKNYLIPVDSAGTFCFGFAPTSGSLSIIGNVQQQGTRVSFDLGNSLVGFSPNKC